MRLSPHCRDEGKIRIGPSALSYRTCSTPSSISIAPSSFHGTLMCPADKTIFASAPRRAPFCDSRSLILPLTGISIACRAASPGISAASPFGMTSEKNAVKFSCFFFCNCSVRKPNDQVPSEDRISALPKIMLRFFLWVRLIEIFGTRQKFCCPA
ncbi:hypothetical protein MnTg02_00805 [bacterium MnTg02]|nr:hypothetical protein MnTg02_00805 [bacterium MnTg02]